MNRTFKTVVGWWYWILIIISSVLLFFFFWQHDYILAFVMAMMVIHEIEMLIHTQYIITSDNTLRIETGRFIKSFTLDISCIESVKLVRSMIFWSPSLSFERLEITYNGKKKTIKVQISPKNKEAFISKLKSINSNISFINL